MASTSQLVLCLEEVVRGTGANRTVLGLYSDQEQNHGYLLVDKEWKIPILKGLWGERISYRNNPRFLPSELFAQLPNHHQWYFTLQSGVGIATKSWVEAAQWGGVSEFTRGYSSDREWGIATFVNFTTPLGFNAAVFLITVRPQENPSKLWVSIKTEQFGIPAGRVLSLGLEKINGLKAVTGKPSNLVLEFQSSQHLSAAISHLLALFQAVDAQITRYS